MIRIAIIAGLLFALLAPVAGQERMASVQLEDGRRLEGRVLSMNLKVLEIVVGNQVLKIPASLIRSCRFHPSGDPATQDPPEATEGGDPAPVRAVTPPVAAAEVVSGDPEPEPEPEPEAEPEAEPAPAPAGEQAPAARTAAAPRAEPPRVMRTGSLPDPVDSSSLQSVPVDQRRSHWQRRIGNLDVAYPWLAPAAPSQWISLGVMLLVGLGLVVHLSVHVAGGEKAQIGRSVGLGVWYLVTGLGQVAMVPINDLSIVLMILLNSSLALFGLVGLFGLPRGGAIVALMVQLGFAVLVFGILELVTAVLSSVGAVT